MEPTQLLRRIITAHHQNLDVHNIQHPQHPQHPQPQQPPVAPPLGQLVNPGNINYHNVDAGVTPLLQLLVGLYQTDTRFSRISVVREHDATIRRALIRLVEVITPNQTYYPLALIMSQQTIAALENLVLTHLLPQAYIPPVTCDCWGCRMRCEAAYMAAQKGSPNRDVYYRCDRL